MSFLQDRRTGGVLAAIVRAQCAWRGAVHRRARRATWTRGLAWAVAAVVLVLGSRVDAQEVECAEIRWTASAGPVVGYDVYAETNGGAMLFYASTVETQIVVAGDSFQAGDVLRFEVVPYAQDGRRGEPSLTSEPIFCASVPTPSGVTAEVDGPIAPVQLTWDPIDSIEFYVVLRATAPGAPGSFVARTEVPAWDDFEAASGVDYYYTVVAVSGRQLSAFSAPVHARWGGGLPRAVASVSVIEFEATPSQQSATGSLSLTNAGGWAVDYQVSSAAPWLSVGPAAGSIEQGSQALTLYYDLAGLPAGVHVGRIDVYSYYTPLPGEEFVLEAPESVEVRVTVPDENRLPVIETSLDLIISEGTTTVVPIYASDPDPGDQVEIWIPLGLPEWAEFESLGNGEARITLAPDYLAAGIYNGVIGAWDDSEPTGFAWRYFTIEVQNTNRAPRATFIPDQTMSPGETLTIPLASYDPDPEDAVAIVPSSLPDFAELDSFGNGHGQITLRPGAGDSGTYLLIVSFVDTSSPPGFSALWFQLTVEK